MTIVPAPPPVVPSALPPADADGTAGWPYLDAIDRSWAGVAYTRAFARVDLPGADRLRQALLDLGRSAPLIGRWVEPRTAHQRPVADGEWDLWLQHTFVTSDDPGGDIDRICALHPADPAWTQFRVIAGPDWISVRMYHSVGDGFTVNAFIGDLLARAADLDSPSPYRVLTARARDRVIARAARRHLRTGLWAVRHRAELAGGDYVPETTDVARGTEQVLQVVSGPDLPSRLRQARDEHFAGASAATVAMVAMRAAFAAELGAPQPGFECLFNTRSDAAGTTGVWGNFSAGVYVRPSDDWSPVAVGEQLQRVRASGLAEFAHASLRVKGRHASGGEVAMPRPVGSPRLTMSYVSRHHMDPYLPGVRAGETLVGTVCRPNGADTLTVQQVECAGRLQVAVAFHPLVWAPERVRAAVDAWLAEPTACIDRVRRDR